jgi:radical SAM protein with 4Fe4S-binding SPASM domain
VEDGHIPELRLRDLAERLRKPVHNDRLPVNGGIDLTYRCNLNCVHCYCNLPANDATAIKDELMTEEIFRILDEIAAAGTLFLLMTGGEPLLRRDFKDIYLYAKKKGFLINLFTNGTMITPAMADFLAEWPPYNLEITMYGFTRDTYERVTRTPGSFERCLTGLRLLRERNIEAYVKIVILTLNQHEFTHVYHFAQELGIANLFRYDYQIYPRLDGGREPLQYRISPEDGAAIDDAEPTLRETLIEYCWYREGKEVPGNLYVCGGGIRTYHIDPYGSLKICVISEPAYDLRRGSFQEGWYQAIPQARAGVLPADHPCRGCAIRAICNQCPARARLEQGDKAGLTLYAHRVAYERARLSGMRAPKERLEGPIDLPHLQSI